MKVAIINPNLSDDISILDMGLTYLATYIEKRTNHEVKLIDFTFRRIGWRRHLAKNIKKFKPDVIAMRCSTLQIMYVKKIAREIKKKYNLPIILGGDHPTLAPEESINFDFADGIIMGEGEFTLTEYLDALESNKSMEGIKGLWVKNKDGTIIKNLPREYIQDIDDLPFPNYDLWEDIDLYIYFLRLIYFIGQRGCPYHCTYCSEHAWNKAVPGKKFRQSSPKRMVEEIAYQYAKYKNKGFDMAHIMDPAFPFDEKWTKEFCDEYKKKGLDKKLPFSVFSTGNDINESKAKMLADANCRIVRIGVEAGSDELRNAIFEKGVSTNQLHKAIQLVKENNMILTCYYLLGGPGETKESLQTTLDVAKGIDAERSVFFIYRPLPGTKSAKSLEEVGGVLLDPKWERTDDLTWGGVIDTKFLKGKEVEQFQRKCFWALYPKRAWNLVKIQKHRYFINLAKYFAKGLRYGCSPKYLFIYYNVCCEENLTN